METSMAVFRGKEIRKTIHNKAEQESRKWLKEKSSNVEQY